MSVKAGAEVLAIATENPDLLRCTSLECRVLIQRTPGGDLADGVRAHYQMCHPERKIR